MIFGRRLVGFAGGEVMADIEKSASGSCSRTSLFVNLPVNKDLSTRAAGWGRR